MKKIVSIQLIIISFLWLSSCAVKTAEKAVNKDVLIVEKPALDSSRFDVKRFEENKRKDGAPNYEFVEGDKDIRQWSDTPERDSPDSLKYYVEEISQKWSPFNIQKRYNNLGILKFWGIFFRNEGINKSYEYDESGKVIKITNYEERYKHSFADIREILLKEKGIDIYDTRQAIGRRVYHKSPTSKEAYYDIYVLDKNNEEKDYRIVIFDDTLELKEYR